MTNNKRRLYLTILITVVILAALAAGGIAYVGPEALLRTTLSGLTLGSLFFMVAAGLSLIFGLMDVLNFAHGSMFMLGAYMGWQFYTNPTFIFGLLPLLTALAAGVMLLPLIKPALIRWKLPGTWRKALPYLAYVLALVLGLLGVLGLDIMSLADTAMVAITTTASNDPLMEISAQEPLAQFWFRPVLLFLSGALIAFGQSRPGDRTASASTDNQRRSIILEAGLVAAAVLLTLFKDILPESVLLMNGNLRFLLSLVTSGTFGILFGIVVEMLLIRPLYQRAFFIVLMTLGLSFVIQEVVQVLWDPLAYQMVRPPLFAQSGKAATVMEWLRNGSATLDIFGVTFPTYRLFVIAFGLLMFLVITIIMTRTRLGMIIRAGVQDPEMVQALGINVRAVFTFVFALGVTMAALGGIGAGPFIPVQPLMGDQYQMQGFITVVLGGMGSYVGAFVGAMILGLARAFGDYFALKLSLSPAIAEASTVIIMVIVLLVRPAGLFGKKE